MNAPTAIPSPKAVPPYKHTPLFPLGKDKTPYRKISSDGVRVETVLGKEMLVVTREALRALSEAAFGDINHYLRPGHLQQLRNILDDSEASDNDKFVALDALKNANIASGGVLPMCQDTGTAIIMGKKGRLVFTEGDDEAALAEGARDAYLKKNLRYSQLAPLTMFETAGTVKLARYTNTLVEIAVDSPNGGIVLLNDVWHPWWRATIDGVETPLHRADYAFRAIDIPQGTHQVKLEYWPRSFSWGLALSLLSILALCLPVFRREPRGRRAP